MLRLRQRLAAIALTISCIPGVTGATVTWAAFVDPTRSQNGMVASAHPLASAVGLQILQQGGNAVDAAVATAFAISVVEPFSAGIGGGGFLLVHRAETARIEALDFREKAPLRASRSMYLNPAGQVIPGASINGYQSVAVPGTIAGLAEVHQRYGLLPWTKVVTPAVALAEKGFPVSDRLIHAIGARQQIFNPAARKVFTRGVQPYRRGELLRQPALARTLRQIAADPQEFYQGEIARAIAADMAANGGLISRQDLATYQPTWREPVCGPFRQVRVCSMPPPSSGGVHLLQMLNLIGDTDLTAQGWHSASTLQLLISAMQIAYADRAVHLGDPEFVQVPVAALTSAEYSRVRRQEIRLGQPARKAAEVKAASPELLQQVVQRPDPQDTSHLTVVDRQRNAVSLTFTVNYSFGSGVVVPGTGILLNDEMDDFAAAPDSPNAYGLVGDVANGIAPGKIPLSSMTPTIVTEPGQLRLATGAPGGSTIITTVLQILLNVLVYDMDAGAAVSAPRLHHQWLPDQVRLEQWGFDAATKTRLRELGYEIREGGEWGNGNIIQVTPTGALEGAADPRGEGAALGY